MKNSGWLEIIRATPMAWLALAFGAGIALGGSAALPLPVGLALAATAGGGAILASRGGREWGMWGLLLLAGLLLGSARYRLATPPLPADHIARSGLPAKNAVVEGTVSAEPAFSPERGTTTLVLATESLRLPGEPTRPVRGLLRATLHWTASSTAAGDRVRLKGTLLLPSGPTNPGQSDFRAGMAHRGVHALLSAWKPGDFSLRERSRPHPAAAALRAIRRWAQDRIDRLVGTPESGLLSSIVFGITSGDFSDEVLDSFRSTGLMHILVASGMNVGILAWLVLAALSRAGVAPARAGLFTLPVLVAYLFLCGAQTPLVRSTLMFGLLLAGQSTGRPSPAVNSLGTAGVVLLLLDPHALWDRSFQLSFGATFGVLTLATFLISRLHPPLPRWLAEAAACTVSAQFILFPLLASLFGQVPVLGAFANLLVTPVMGVLLSGGLALLALGSVPLLGPALGLGLKWSLTAILWVVESFARLPFASTVVPPLSPVAWGAYLAWIAGILLWIRSLPPPASIEKLDRRPLPPPLLEDAPARAGKILAVAGAGTLAVLAWFAALRPAPGDLSVTFLDVGEGAAAVVRLPSGRAILVDAGPAYAGGAVVAPYLKSRGIGRLAAVVITHPHADHFAGLPPLLRQVRADALLISGQGLAENGSFRDVQRSLARRETAVRIVHAGMEIRGEEGVRLRFLNPPRGFLHAGPRADQTDNNSLAFAVEYGRTAALFVGDLKSAGEKRLGPAVRAIPGRDLLLAVPHHGSITSSSRGFLNDARPRHAVVSVGARNPFGHPHRAVLIRYRDQGAEILRTDREGAVAASSDGAGWTLERAR